MRLLTEEQKHWVEVIGDFCKKEIEPIMLDWDKVVDPSKAIPFEPYAKAFKLGLNSFEIPKEYGGTGADPLAAAICVEELSKQCASRSTWLPLRLCTKRWATMTATSLPSCRPPTWL